MLTLERSAFLSDGHASEPAPAVEPLGEGGRQTIRYERGSAVYATDGMVGTLRQVVVDEDAGDVQALVVRMAAKNESVLVPPDLVARNVASSLLLNVTREQFVAGAGRSPRFAPRMFTAADRRRLLEATSLLARGDVRRSLVSLSADRVETSDAVIPAAPSSPRRGRLTLFGRR